MFLKREVVIMAKYKMSAQFYTDFAIRHSAQEKGGQYEYDLFLAIFLVQKIGRLYAKTEPAKIKDESGEGSCKS